MPIGLSDKVRTAVQGVFSADGNKAKDRAKDRVVTLDKPYTYDGKAVSVIDLSGVEELTSKDVSAAENEVLKTGIYSANMSTFSCTPGSTGFPCHRQPHRVFYQDAAGGCGEGAQHGELCIFFRVSGGAKALRKLAIAASSATHTGIDFFMQMPIGDFLDACKDIQEMQNNGEKQCTRTQHPHCGPK